MASKYTKPRNRGAKQKSIVPSIEETIVELYEPLVPGIEERLLTGYAYTIDSPSTETLRSIRISTGKGGVMMYVDACRKNGLPERMIAESITVQTDQGPITLDKLTVKKNG